MSRRMSLSARFTFGGQGNLRILIRLLVFLTKLKAKWIRRRRSTRHLLNQTQDVETYRFVASKREGVENTSMGKDTTMKLLRRTQTRETRILVWRICICTEAKLTTRFAPRRRVLTLAPS